MGMLNNFKVNSLSKCIFQATIQTVLKKYYFIVCRHSNLQDMAIIFFILLNLIISKKKLKQVSDFGEIFVCWLSKSS